MRRQRQRDKQAEQPETLYEYVLPADEQRVICCAFTLGYLVAYRDYQDHPRRSQESILEQARAGCEQLKTQTTAKNLTNDFDAFCALFIPRYMQLYQGRQSAYQRDAAAYQADQQVIGQLSWELAYTVLYWHYSVLLEALREQEARLCATLAQERENSHAV